MNKDALRLSGRNSTRILTRREERDAAIAWRDQKDEAARLLIIQAHMKLVNREARRMRHYRVDPDDLASEGMLGLTLALDKYDPDSGFRFSTYAIYWIRATMKDFVMKNDGVMRLSSTGKFKSLFFSYRKAAAKIVEQARQSGEVVSRGEIQERTAKALGVSVEDIRIVEVALSTATQLDAPLGADGDDDGGTIADMIPDEGLSPEDILNEVQVARYLETDIAAAMARLKPREQHIVAARKLVPDEEIMTLEDLSQIYDVSRERIRQIEASALKKLETSLAPALEVLDAA